MKAKDEKKYSYPKWRIYKNLKINPKVHDKLREYCDTHDNSAMYAVAEKAIMEYIKK